MKALAKLWGFLTALVGGLFKLLNNEVRWEIKDKTFDRDETEKAETRKQRNRKQAAKQERKADKQERKTDRKK